MDLKIVFIDPKQKYQNISNASIWNLQMIFFKAKIGMNDINQLLNVNQNSDGLNFFYFLNL
jgi:hypothetical protein